MSDLAFEIETLNRAVDDFADVMKEKLARKAGAGCRGWSNGENAADFVQDAIDTACELEDDPTQAVDLANYAMMLWFMNRCKTGGVK